MTRGDILAQMRQAFVKSYAPNPGLYDFEMDLDSLIYAAYAAAQEPFVRELDRFRDHTLKVQTNNTRLK